MANPYLVFTFLLKSGLEGIKNNILPPEEVNDDLFGLSLDEIFARGISSLPGSLQEAVEKLEKSNFAKEVLGQKLHSYYVDAKKIEVEKFRTAITDWELKQYS